MKKTFCDCCGDEMVYDEKVAVLNGKTNSVDMRMGQGPMRQFGLVVEISPKMVSNGEHVDICAGCRWKMFDKLDPRPTLPDPAELLTKAIQIVQGMEIPIQAGTAYTKGDSAFEIDQAVNRIKALYPGVK